VKVDARSTPTLPMMQAPSAKARPKPRASSNLLSWIVGTAAGLLLISAIIYRLREAAEPAAPTVTTPPADAATAPPSAPIIERVDDATPPRPTRRQARDLIDPFPRTDDAKSKRPRSDEDLLDPFPKGTRPTKKKKRKKDEDLTIISPSF
jgi:hypothetical protein